MEEKWTMITAEANMEDAETRANVMPVGVGILDLVIGLASIEAAPQYPNPPPEFLKIRILLLQRRTNWGTNCPHMEDCDLEGSQPMSLC